MREEMNVAAANAAAGKNAWQERLSGDMKKVLDALSDLKPQPIESLSAEAARKQPTPADAAQSLLRQQQKDRVKDPGVETKDIVIEGAAGPLAARVYYPKSVDKAQRHPLPMVTYWHGGGFVIADLDVYDASPRAIAGFANCIVVSCHYRQAPENKFPAAHEDAFAAYKWVLAHASELGGDPDKVAVMGESAGGNLAMNVAIRARDEGVRQPAHQVLVYPVAGNDMNTPSYIENEFAKPLNKAMMKWFVEKYLNSPSEAADPRINLLGANLDNLPDATIITAEIDPLRSEGDMLSDKLKAAGAEVHHHTYLGVTHEFFGMGLLVKDAANAEHMVARNLKRAFGTAMLPI